MNGVSVVIPTAGGRADILERSLRTILDDPATGEVVIVADEMDGLTEDLLRRIRARDSRLRVLAGAGGTDHGQSNRDAGVRAARGQLILAIDDDIEPASGLVGAHADRHAKSERLVLLGYMPVATVVARRGAARTTALFYAQTYERECRMFECSPESILLRLWGGNMSLRRQDWLAATGSGAGAYHVDREFGLRLRALGMNATFDRNLRAIHHYRRTAAELLNDALLSGIGQARLHVLHPELSALEPAPAPSSRLPPLLWRGRSRWRMRTVGGALLAGAEVAALVHASQLESTLVRAIWALGFSRGIYEAGELIDAPAA
jgi:glycosyltransferase involved in cell wall biosynthesis